MNFSALSIKHPVPAILLFALLTLAGLLAYKANGVQDFPDIQLPMVTVTASLPGAAPAQLEVEVARKIEDAVATLQGVKNIFTNVLDGVVSITVEFILDKDSAEAVNDVREAVSRVRADLPDEMRDPVVTKVSTAGRVLLTYTLSSDSLDEQALSWFVDNTMTKRLLAVPGVGSVKRLGGVTREIRVELDAERMTALGVSAADVSRQLRQVQREAPGGRGEVSGAEQTMRTIATVQSAAALGALELPLADGRRIRLDQVARVTDTTAERRAVALQDGKPVVAVEVFRTKGASELDVVGDANHGARQAVAQLRDEYPGVRFVESIDNVAPIAENFDGSMTLLYEGAVLAVLVVWWFLRDWRATFIAAVALPLSIIPAFLGMYWFGYTLNTVTLTSLALVIGILVDDAIVEIENIARHLRMGKTPYEAAMEAADEIGFAVIATTFALVAVFLPTAFMGGIPGKFFKQFGWAAVLAILSSLLVARLLTPMMAAYMLKPVKEAVRRDGWIMRAYLSMARWCLRHRLLTLIAAVLFFVGSLSLIPLLPTGFVPPSDRNQTLINIELPPGSTLAETWATAERARLAAQEVPGVRGVFSSIGGGSSGDAFAPGTAAEVRRAVLTLTLVHRNERRESLSQIETQLRARLDGIPGARFKVGPPDTGVKMQIVLKSEDPAALLAASRAAERELRTLRGVGNVSSSAALTQPEIIVRPDFARAADLGVTAQAIAETVRVATAGDYETALAKLNLAERQVPIRVKLPRAVRADLAQLERLLVPGRNGPVMLGTVAALSLESGPAEINRLNRSRNVILEVELGSRQLGEAYAEAMQLPALRELSPGVTVAQLGDAQEMQALFASFGIAMLIGVLCIYGVLVLLFHDFMQPATILAALPLSIGGAFVGLLLTGKALSMPSMIGLIMLMGIVTKNSILLVDYAILARRRGLARFEALVDACHKRSRPIVMTTIAMGAGMLPLALGYGADPSFRSPMAIAVIGGLITSTLLSLLVVPAIFTYIDDATRIAGKVVRAVRRPPRPAAAEEA
ncbi:MAG: efflux RND transporter permease subunit [Gammaproteobacteria bacterium]|nr:efflux RND transporter permease subunit [Gammaproteobacteria bacterium]